MKRKLATVVLALAAVAVLLPARLLAQDKRNEDPNTRMVQGIVTDAGNQPVKGAVVKLKDMKTLQIRSFYTLEDGSYHFAGLSTNADYELRAEYNGSESATKTLSNFDSRKTPRINLKLK